ncbi:hypothetical protein GA0061078_1204 [Bifidobacterium bohemicum]|uniref:Uncharacterized protein n=1 Tax=Bifidobacterium bohemicum DSM 22767 TaxID=1437606 RepID=A0A086ZGA2_9BIFI|nr:hypothetical protein [Bifidobacterium bohemicum]KFI45552.1 hypothetical protein BBOH_1036 [Bifidobacterium bohemicum DSM 22767]SCC02073.1 hypothetical protein GA0061078_1204 [Bifidobacterium bohemicum]
MEIGPLAEWFTAIAETAAVLVALFMPYHEKRESEKKNSHAVKALLLTCIDQALEDGQTAALNGFIRTVTLTDASHRDADMIEIGKAVLNTLADQNIDEETKHKRVLEYRSQLYSIDK